MNLTSQASIQIQKPVHEVFDGITNPEKMTKYFISKSTGSLTSGQEVFWQFPEFDGSYPVNQVNVQPNSIISFVWDPGTVVRIELEEQADGSTVVSVTEGSKPLNEENMKWLVSNTGGWANFLACLKAYLEYDIQLRKGAYEFMRESK